MRVKIAAAVLAAMLLDACAAAPRLSSTGSAPLAVGGPVAVIAMDEADPLGRDAAQALQRRLAADGVQLVETDQASRLLQVGLVRVSNALDVATPDSPGAPGQDFGAPAKGVRRWLGARESYRLSIVSIDRATGRLIESRWASLPAAAERARTVDRLVEAALASGDAAPR